MSFSTCIFPNARVVAVFVVDARVQQPAVVPRIVPVNGLEAHVTWSIMSGFWRDIVCVDDLASARAVLGTTEDEHVVVRVGDVRFATGRLGSLLGKNASYKEERREEECMSVEMHGVTDQGVQQG